MLLPLDVNFGSQSASKDYAIGIPEQDVKSLDIDELEECNVCLHVVVDKNKNSLYTIHGSYWDVETFIKLNLRVGAYHRALEQLEQLKRSEKNK